MLSSIIFYKLLVRGRHAPRERVCNFPEDDEYSRMYAAAEQWTNTYAGNKTDVCIENDGLKLYGEYYDFGGDRAVIILPGRTETCRYSCYFAEPYRVSGCNVLVVDGRAHGLSDGRINCLGFREYKDLLCWAKMLNTRYHMQKIYFHGVCIGASTSLMACTAKDCPDYVSGMTAEGMYRNFYETTRFHMMDKHRPLFPFLYLIMVDIRLFCGGSAVTNGPVRHIGKMRKPILFLHSRKDIFSLPVRAQALFDECPAKMKRLVWFDRGAHSMVRINNTRQYDDAICEFMCELKKKEDNSYGL